MILFKDIVDLFNIDRDPYSELTHSYYLSANTKVGKNGPTVPFKLKKSVFSQRGEAEAEMYKVANKLGIGKLVKIEDDKHFKTYTGENEKWITFQINRDGLGD